MRELILIGVVALICVVALFRPRIGLYGYTWFALMRPDILAWSYGKHPYSFALAVCLLIGMVSAIDSVPRIFRSPIALALMAMVAVIVLSAFSAVNPALSIPELNLYLRIIVMVLLVPVLIQNLDHLREYVLVIALSIGLLGAKYGLAAVLRGGAHYAQGYGGFMSDNNTMAMAFAMAVPMCWHLQSVYRMKWFRLMMISVAFLLVVGTVMTYSRGAVVGLAPVLLLISWRAKNRFVTLSAVAVIAMMTLSMATARFLGRWEFVETGQLDASAASRIEQVTAAVKMWKDHPLLGVGFGTRNWIVLSPPYMGHENYHVVHNTYAQMLVDSGPLALLLFVGLLGGTMVWLQRVAGQARRLNHPVLGIAYALQSGLIVYAITGMTVMRIELDLLYFILMSAAALHVILKDEGLETMTLQDPQGAAFSPSVPVDAPKPQPIAASMNSAPPVSVSQRPNVGIATATRERLRNGSSKPR